MKKIIGILLILATVLSFFGCSSSSIEEQLVSNGKRITDDISFSHDNISISKIGNDYVVTVNQIQRTYSIVQDDKSLDEFVWTNIQEITSSNILKIVTSSKNLIIGYINESLVLKNKEDLISYINSLPVKVANFPNNSLVAAFDENYDTIFVNIKSNLLDKHTLVHELFHALSNKTRINAVWNSYCTSKFDEAFTELLSNSIIKSNYPTAYDKYIKYVYAFIGCTGLNGISAYFYGLNELQIPRTEFHLYSIALECLDNCKTNKEIKSEELTLYLVLSKWGLEK